jgi:UDP-2,4-diacetamido-2,4,6-trideoxy-beta-L-altropyranose hydrolase
MIRNLYIRVDGNQKIGLGHLTRCIGLAEILSKKFNIFFISKNITENIKVQLQKKKINLIIIKRNQQFLSLLKLHDIVVIDGYNFSDQFQKKIKLYCKTLICIDDLIIPNFNADIIINHSPGVKKNDYKVKKNTKLALGLEYALLRPAFLRKNKRITNNSNAILICFGGSDNLNLTLKYLKYIMLYTKISNIYIITGDQYMHEKKVFNFIKNDKKVKYFNSINENEIIKIMRKVNLAILPSSSIMIEALSQNLKVIGGYYIENQVKAYNNFKHNGLISGIGNLKNATRSKLFETLDLALDELKSNNFKNIFPNNKLEGLFNEI